jgi:hypothetical protein
MTKEATMCTKWTTSLLIAMLAGAPAAWADGKGGGADPSTKTLPAKASDTAKANAFGQQGDRSKAIHQAAHAAAADQARGAVVQAQVQPATSTTRPSAAAQAHASATGVSNGFDRASAGSANGQSSTPGQGAAHRHQ